MGLESPEYIVAEVLYLPFSKNLNLFLQDLGSWEGTNPSFPSTGLQEGALMAATNVFLDAVKGGNLDVVRHCLEYGPRSLVCLRDQRTHNRSPLLLACMLGDSRIVGLLLTRCIAFLELETGMRGCHQLYFNADRDDQGNGSLHVLLSNQTQETSEVLKCLLLLLEAGVRPDLRNAKGLTPLHVLARNSPLAKSCLVKELAEALIDKGAEVNAVDQEGVSPLLLASVGRCWELCRVLLARSADLNLAAPSSAALLTSSPVRSPTRRPSPAPAPPAPPSLSPTPKMCRKLHLGPSPPASPTLKSTPPSVSSRKMLSLSPSQHQQTPRSPQGGAPRLSPAITATAAIVTPSSPSSPTSPPSPLSPQSPARGNRNRGDSMVALLDAINSAAAYQITAADMIPRSMRRGFFALMEPAAQSATKVGDRSTCAECAKPLIVEAAPGAAESTARHSSLFAESPGSKKEGKEQQARQGGRAVTGVGTARGLRLGLGLGLRMGLGQTGSSPRSQPPSPSRSPSSSPLSPSASTSPSFARSCVHCRRVVCASCCRFAYPQGLVAMGQGLGKGQNVTPQKPIHSVDRDTENFGNRASTTVSPQPLSPVPSSGTQKGFVCEACIRAICDKASLASDRLGERKS